jgi:hypothetical protein
MRNMLIVEAALVACCVLSAASAVAGTVTTITVTQEERKSQRWTLDEWLRTKERMRMMDLWLAIFSNPKKDRFRPELNLGYHQLRGRSDQGERRSVISGHALKADLMLSNLLTGTTGVRLVNIDLGIGGDYAETRARSDDSTGDQREQKVAYSAILRLFGKSTQDSSLMLRYGKERREQLDVTQGSSEAGEASELSSAASSDPSTGYKPWFGGDIQLYMLHSFGAEATYRRLRSGLSSERYEYGGFIEVSLMRLYFGLYQERYEEAVERVESGSYAGAKLQF